MSAHKAAKAGGIYRRGYSPRAHVDVLFLMLPAFVTRKGQAVDSHLGWIGERK
jgi:hypothetical protein